MSNAYHLKIQIEKLVFQIRFAKILLRQNSVKLNQYYVKFVPKSITGGSNEPKPRC
jgi:hypothetical protein